MRIKTDYLLAAVFLASGAALLVYVSAGVSLALALGVAILLVSSVWVFVWKNSSSAKKKQLLMRIRVGLLAGVMGTAFYDASRFLLIKITGIQFWPFDIFNIFGQAILGQSAHGFWVAPIGVAFHFLNGITFAISYTILFGTRGVLFGILWALMLEALMVATYPSWLKITFMSEFLSVSIAGHFVYGATIGYLAKRVLFYYASKGGVNEQK